MKKKGYILIGLILAASLAACSKNNATSQKEAINSVENVADTIITGEDSDGEDTNQANKADEASKLNSAIDVTNKTDQTTQDVEEETVEEVKQKPETATATISNQIPEKYLKKMDENCGTIEHIEYKTKDYFGDNAEITKYAYVYLPYGYDETKSYNVLYLMHGIGGNEREWGMIDDFSRVKIMMDNLIFNGDIEPFIIVAPNGRSGKDFANTNSDYKSFYLFGQELRNDLIPFIEQNYATYANVEDANYDPTSVRAHRAMAGLSMGGMQTINIGMCECLDLISYFGAFSAAPTTNTSTVIATTLKEFPDYDIKYFYNICGTEDGIALASSSAATRSLTDLTDKLVDGENFMWQEVPGGHDFNIWYLGFYNFAQLAFTDNDAQ